MTPKTYEITGNKHSFEFYQEKHPGRVFEAAVKSARTGKYMDIANIGRNLRKGAAVCIIPRLQKARECDVTHQTPEIGPLHWLLMF